MSFYTRGGLVVGLSKGRRTLAAEAGGKNRARRSVGRVVLSFRQG
jgi:hypothetical protein